MTRHGDQQEVIRHVLWHFKSAKGFEPGSFTQNLMRAFQTADPSSFRRLTEAFPDYGSAMWIAMNNQDGVQNLEAMLDDPNRPVLKVVNNTTPEGETP
jgi:hypothetical protein